MTVDVPQGSVLGIYCGYDRVLGLRVLTGITLMGSAHNLPVDVQSDLFGG